MKIPVVVVGAGACGLVAALAARDAGAEVLVLERDASPSGSSALSSGFIPAGGTRWQRAAGVADSPEAFSGDIQQKNHDQSDAGRVRALCEAAARTLEWLADAHGVPFGLLRGFTYPGHGCERMHALPEKTGAALMAALLRAASEKNIAILCSARTVDARPGRVRFERPDGRIEEAECEALVLACSGFGGNPAMVREHLPEIADALYFGHAGNQGDAMRWGTALGAGLAHMGAYQGHGSVATPHGVLITWALMTEGGIQVNADGERFSNEHLGYSEQCLPVLEQPGRHAWCIYDERLHQLGLTFPDYQEAVKAGAVRPAPELPRLKETLKEIEAFRQGKADPFGRDFTTRPPLMPPLYGVKVTGALFHTQGGLAVDTQARVLDRQGQPIPGLYAGGGAAAGVSGDEVWGYLSGNGLLSAVVLGRIAGENAALWTSN